MSEDEKLMFIIPEQFSFLQAPSSWKEVWPGLWVNETPPAEFNPSPEYFTELAKIARAREFHFTGAIFDLMAERVKRVNERAEPKE